MSRPLFSVVIPSYNRRDTLERVLAAYEHQTPADLPFEVVVVDDGSSDGTRELLAAWRPRRYRFRFAHQDNSGPARARNRGIALASGELVLFTGDDIEPAPTLLAEHWRGHQALSDPGVLILGLTRWPPDAALTHTMRHIDGVGAQQFSYQYMKDGAEYDFRHFYTSNVSIRRRLLDREPGYFSTDFPAAAFEDAELSYRLAGHGARIVYRAAAEAYHHHHYTAGSFFRRQQRCGEMAAVLYRMWPQLEKWLGLKELGWCRVELARSDAVERHRVSLLAADLGRWERRAIGLAAFFDPLEVPPVDDLLYELFRYAYVKGLAEALYEPDVARRLCAAFYLDIFPAVAARFAVKMKRARLPFPRADQQAILSCRPLGDDAEL